ncbi:tRNA (uracil-5-)-methyltransferase homolog B isoform X2 [Rhipicephalus sanguineus]|uniref:tRNA (uracil-5-)-methyltransferase homolog B isoform X2 n=1 Tax=Rhipicephalus sanguineus TaxID=34632 RepID=UPI0020C4F933|nr:tRNA (uracil-5-)-methyltransferase homolog B isoform X2 [Rhipicephalus sanguineus]
MYDMDSLLTRLVVVTRGELSFGKTRLQRSLRTAARRVVPLFDKGNAPGEPPPTEPKQEKMKENDEARLKRLREKFHVDGDNKFDKLAHSVTPLWRHPYKKQLMFKYQDVCKQLQYLGQKLRKVEVAFPADPKGLPCPVRPVLPSPIIEGYRNKDEFSIRQGPNGEPKTVGFLVGSPADLDHVVCVSPEHITVCKDSHKRVAKSFEEYIQRSPLPGCYESHFQGYWKHLVVRSNSAGQLMAIVVMHPQQLTPEELSREKQGLVEHFVHGPGREGCSLSSLYFQACRHSRCTHAQAPFELLHGQPYLEETLGGVRFRISPESFFQVNSPVATYLYDAVRQLLRPKPQGTLLDVCCGTGIRNAQYQVGRAEVLLPQLRHQFVAEELSAVVNPGRGGLNKRAIRALREYKQIKRLVYISCKPEGVAMDNAVELCDSRPKAHKVGPPFQLQLACPVDMFPQTRHCELLLLFVR